MFSQSESLVEKHISSIIFENPGGTATLPWGVGDEGLHPLANL